MTTQTTERVLSGYEALSRGDVQPIIGLLDEKVEWSEAEHVPYWPGRAFTGPDAVLRGVFARIAEDFEGFRVDVERVKELGDTLLVEARYRGRVRATGRPLDAQAAHVWEFRDGKAVRWQQYTDTWQFAEVTQPSPSS